MNKRSRTEEIDIIEEFPFLKKSLDACRWIQLNPIPFRIFETSIEVFQYLNEYIRFVFKSFFANCNMFFIDTEEYFIVDEKGLDITIRTPVERYTVDYHFGFLMKSLEDSILTYLGLLNDPRYSVTIFSEGTLITISANRSSYNIEVKQDRIEYEQKQEARLPQDTSKYTPI